MKTLFGIVGASVGLYAGAAIAMLAVIATNNGNTTGEVFTLIETLSVVLIVGMPLGVFLTLRLRRSIGIGRLSHLSPMWKIVIPVSTTLLIPTVIFALYRSSLNRDNPPSDAALIDNFRRHQSDFERIAQMAEQDHGLKQVADTWTQPDNPRSIGVAPS